MDVIATALVSAIGYDAPTVCAAVRAGVTRAGPLPFVTLENDESPGVAVGHAARLLTDGFEGDARLVRLLSGAFVDLLARLDERVLGTAHVAYYLSLPPADREWQGLALLGSDEAQARYLDWVGPAPVVDEVRRAARVVDQAMRLAGLSRATRASARTLRVATTGHTGVTSLCARARHDFETGTIDLAVVAGVDSLAQPTTLEWLARTGRLKSAESPTGIAPGEAAALLVLTVPGRSSGPDRVALGSMVHTLTQASQTSLLEGHAPDGRTQAEILGRLAAVTGTSVLPWVITDQNGEIFRAGDWGNSLVRLRAQGVTVSDASAVWYPVASIGDVGAATAAVAATLALGALERGYAPAPLAYLTASSDGEGRSGCIVQASQEFDHVSR